MFQGGVLHGQLGRSTQKKDPTANTAQRGPSLNPSLEGGGEELAALRAPMLLVGGALLFALDDPPMPAALVFADRAALSARVPAPLAASPSKASSSS